MARLMTKGRSRFVVALLLCSLGGIGVKLTIARLAAPEHSALSAPVPLPRRADSKSTARQRSLESPAIAELRTRLEAVKVPSFHLKRVAIRHAALHLEKCIRETDPARQTRIKTARRENETPEFLKTNEEYRRGRHLLWPQHDYHLENVSAWQVVRRLASDYSMEIQERGGGIILVPRG
jgi:hypothetical protein